jgi:hypothetical protein
MRSCAIIGIIVLGLGCQHSRDRTLDGRQETVASMVHAPVAAGPTIPAAAANGWVTLPGPTGPVAEATGGRAPRERLLSRHKRQDTTACAAAVTEQTEEVILVPTVVYVPHVMKQVVPRGPVRVVAASSCDVSPTQTSVSVPASGPVCPAPGSTTAGTGAPVQVLPDLPPPAGTPPATAVDDAGRRLIEILRQGPGFTPITPDK